MKIRKIIVQTREILVLKARVKYIATGATKNISEAVRWFLEAYPELATDNPLTLTVRDSRSKFNLLRPAVIRLSKEERAESYKGIKWGRRKPCRGQASRPKGENPNAKL